MFVAREYGAARSGRKERVIATRLFRLSEGTAEALQQDVVAMMPRGGFVYYPHPLFLFFFASQLAM